MIKITVGVEGMACGMCEAYINEAVRNAFAVKRGCSLRFRDDMMRPGQSCPSHGFRS